MAFQPKRITGFRTRNLRTDEEWSALLDVFKDDFGPIEIAEPRKEPPKEVNLRKERNERTREAWIAQWDMERDIQRRLNELDSDSEGKMETSESESGSESGSGADMEVDTESEEEWPPNQEWILQEQETLQWIERAKAVQQVPPVVRGTAYGKRKVQKPVWMKDYIAK